MTDVLPARASRCSSACQQLEKGAVSTLVPPLLTAVSIYHALRSSCAERDSNFKLRRQNEAVRSDGRDSRGLPETCERSAWRIRDPTWRKRDPTWRKRRKSDKIGEKVNFFGEKKIIRASSCAGGAGPPPPPATTRPSDSNNAGKHTTHNC